jgi:hypothetical protein
MDSKIPLGKSSSSLPSTIPIKPASKPTAPWTFHEHDGPVENIVGSTPAPSFSNIRDEKYKPCDRIAYPSWPKQSDWLTEEVYAPIFLDQAIRKMENGHLQGFKVPKFDGELLKGELMKPKKLNLVLDFSDDEDEDTIQNVDQKPQIWSPVNFDKKKIKWPLVVRKRKTKCLIGVKARVAYRNKSFPRLAGTKNE